MDGVGRSGRAGRDRSGGSGGSWLGFVFGRGLFLLGFFLSGFGRDEGFVFGAFLAGAFAGGRAHVGLAGEDAFAFGAVFPEVTMGGVDGLKSFFGNGGQFGLERDALVLGGGLIVFGNLLDHALRIDAVLDAAGIFHGDVKGAQDEGGALGIDGVAHERVDDFHQRVLDGFFIFD